MEGENDNKYHGGVDMLYCNIIWNIIIIGILCWDVISVRL